MIIEAITLCNFGAYAGEQTLRPARRTATGGAITLVGGMNGYGKTSLLEGVLLALYGHRSPAVRERGGGYAAYLKALAHRGVPPDAECGVGLELVATGGDGDARLAIRRSWRANDARGSELLTIRRDGVEDAHLAEHWDTYVEELVPSGIAGLFFFDGERISELAESEETTDALRQAIRALLGLETVDRLIADLDVVMRRNRPRIKDTRVRDELARLQRESDEAQALYDRARQRLAELQNMIAKAARRCHELEAAHARAGGDLVAGRARLEARREAMREALAEIRAEAGALTSGALPLLLVRPRLERAWETARDEEEAGRARLALPLLREHDEALLRELRRTVADVAALAHLEGYLGAREATVAEVAAREATFPLSPAASAQLADLANGTFDELRAQAMGLRQRYEEAERELDRIERYLQAEPDRLDGVDGVDRVGELVEARARLVELERERGRLDRELQDYRTVKEGVDRRIAEVGVQVAAVEEAERIVRFAARSQETMRTFRERVTRTKIAHLARQILDAFGRLTHKRSLVADIRVDPDSLHITLFDVSAREIPKARLSSGERQMLAVAILWGLGRASGRTLPVIIDTPMGRLDSSHRRTFVNQYLPNASHQVIVLSTDTEITGAHLDSLNGQVGRRYRLAFDEERQGTRIVEGYFAAGVGV